LLFAVFAPKTNGKMSKREGFGALCFVMWVWHLRKISYLRRTFFEWLSVSLPRAVRGQWNRIVLQSFPLLLTWWRDVYLARPYWIGGE